MEQKVLDFVSILENVLGKILPLSLLFRSS